MELEGVAPKVASDSEADFFEPKVSQPQHVVTLFHHAPITLR
jgi:hypothetical protein